MINLQKQHYLLIFVCMVLFFYIQTLGLKMTNDNKVLISTSLRLFGYNGRGDA